MQVQCLTNRLNTEREMNNEVGSNTFLDINQEQILTYTSAIFTGTYKKEAIPKS